MLTPCDQHLISFSPSLQEPPLYGLQLWLFYILHMHEIKEHLSSFLSLSSFTQPCWTQPDDLGWSLTLRPQTSRWGCMSETFSQQACPSAEKEWPIGCAVDCVTLEQRSERFTLYSKKIRLSQVWGSSSLITSHAGTCHPGLFRSLRGTDAQETATNTDVPQEEVYIQG